MKPIWIVDDDQSIRFVLEKALLREHLPTRSFTNPRDVLAALDEEDEGPQVLVSDIRMPGGSGLELLEKVKASHPGLPVIIMTAFSDLDSAVSAFQGGAFEYLPKPFDLPKAVELIRRAVEESQREEVAQESHGRSPRDAGPGPGHAGRVPRHRPTLAEQCHGDDHRRVGFGQGAGGACPAQAFAARQRAFRGHQHRGDPEGSAGERAVRPRARCLHRRADHAPRPLRAGRWRHAVSRRNRRHAVRPADPPAACAVAMAISTAWAATARSRPMCA